MPIASAATSSSRIAVQARPMRERTMREIVHSETSGERERRGSRG